MVVAIEQNVIDTQNQRLNDKFSDQNCNVSSTSTESSFEDVNLKQSNPIKCSAIHSLERDMPSFDYSNLVRELRVMILKESENNLFSHNDVERCKTDDWYLSRFLLRHKLDLDSAFEMLKNTLRARNESLFLSLRDVDFPSEFYQTGGVFSYEPDRKGNKMLYLRVKIHKKIPEIQLIFQAFLANHINKIDEEANGKGIAIVFDCSGGGLANADMDLLLFFFSTLNNYFPKGLSYLLVHEIPWILKPIWHIAKAWVPEDKRELIKFSDSKTIFEYVDKENLPDFMGGTCKRNYREVPENCTTLAQASKIWGIEKSIIRRAIQKFADYLPPDSLQKLDQLDDDDDDAYSNNNKTTNENDSDQENKN